MLYTAASTDLTHSFVLSYIMRLCFPSFTLGAIGIFIPTQADQEVHGVRGRTTKSQHDATTADIQQSQDLSSLLLRQKMNTKFFHCLKIASTNYDFVSASHEECSPYPDFFKMSSRADFGILARCSNPQDVCIKNPTSSIGGTCGSSSDDMRPIDYNDSHVNQRQLLQAATCTYKNGTGGGTKCQGWNACFGLDEAFIESNIGCGSCNGQG
jgi:hypothetical protein